MFTVYHNDVGKMRQMEANRLYVGMNRMLRYVTRALTFSVLFTSILVIVLAHVFGYVCVFVFI